MARRALPFAALAAAIAGGTVGATPATAAPVLTTLGVVEMRSGSSELPGVVDRLAEIARKATSLAIVGPGDARRRPGVDVDASVARCAGDPPCLATVGQRLGVRSLLVVAVSQLGEVIVAVQLIDVDSRKVVGRFAESMPAGTGLDDAALRDWLDRVLPREAFMLYGTLSIHTEPPGATLEIDGEVRGVSPMPPIRLPAPSLYQVRLTKAGHKPFGTSVDVQPDRTIEVLADLPREDVTPVYRRPWVWVAVFVGLAAGTLAGISLATPESTTVDGHAVVVHPPR